MIKAYNISLRWRVIRSFNGGLGAKQIAERLFVSETFVRKILKLYEQTKAVSDPPRRRGVVRIIQAAELRIMRKLIEGKPELYLDEIQSWLEHSTGNVYSLPTLSRAIRNMGFSLKKMHVIAYQRNEYARAHYRRAVSQFKPHQFLFIDESSKDDRTLQRKFGRYLINKRLNREGRYTRGARYSVLAAISANGVKAAHTITGAYDQRNFEFAMEQFVLPHIGSFCKGEECSVVVMDNCSIHSSSNIIEQIHSKGGMVIFLPPYSPDMNPAEEAFSIAKRWIKRNQDICMNYSKRCFDVALHQIPGQHCKDLLSDCGYV